MKICKTADVIGYKQGSFSVIFGYFRFFLFFPVFFFRSPWAPWAPWASMFNGFSLFFIVFLSILRILNSYCVEVGVQWAFFFCALQHHVLFVNGFFGKSLLQVIVDLIWSWKHLFFNNIDENLVIDEITSKSCWNHVPTYARGGGSGASWLLLKLEIHDFDMILGWPGNELLSICTPPRART